MNAVAPLESAPEHSELCTITVLYDGDVTRQRAMAACDFLVHQFWQHVELEFHWWRLDFLRDPQLARAAAQNAVAADFLIFSSDIESHFSPQLESWFESWLEERHGPEGALVDLRPQRRIQAGEREVFLQEVCRRGGFDYLTTMPGDVTGAATQPKSLDSVAKAGNGGPEHYRPPSHHGLNE